MSKVKTNDEVKKEKTNRDNNKLTLQTRPIRVRRILPDGSVITESEYMTLVE